MTAHFPSSGKCSCYTCGKECTDWNSLATHSTSDFKWMCFCGQCYIKVCAALGVSYATGVDGALGDNIEHYVVAANKLRADILGDARDTQRFNRPKVYRGECPCGILHPQPCDYHIIVGG